MIEEKNRIDQNKYISILKEVDLRPTKQRVMLISNIYKYGNRHINADKLHKEILYIGEKVSLATVYNTLNHLTNAGLLRQVKVNMDKKTVEDLLYHVSFQLYLASLLFRFAFWFIYCSGIL